VLKNKPPVSCVCVHASTRETHHSTTKRTIHVAPLLRTRNDLQEFNGVAKYKTGFSVTRNKQMAHVGPTMEKSRIGCNFRQLDAIRIIFWMNKISVGYVQDLTNIYRLISCTLLGILML